MDFKPLLCVITLRIQNVYDYTRTSSFKVKSLGVLLPLSLIYLFYESTFLLNLYHSGLKEQNECSSDSMSLRPSTGFSVPIYHRRGPDGDCRSGRRKGDVMWLVSSNDLAPDFIEPYSAFRTSVVRRNPHLSHPLPSPFFDRSFTGHREVWTEVVSTLFRHILKSWALPTVTEPRGLPNGRCLCPGDVVDDP